LTLILKQFFSLFHLLNSEKGSHQIAAGLPAGFILGLTPALSLHSLLIFFCIFIFRIQLAAALISAFLFKFVGHLFDPLFHLIGAWILERPELQNLFTQMYNMPLVPYTRFNNSIVMGAGAVTLVTSPLVFIIFRAFIFKYRETIVAKFKESRFWKFVKATAFYKWYSKYDQLYG